MATGVSNRRKLLTTLALLSPAVLATTLQEAEQSALEMSQEKKDWLELGERIPLETHVQQREPTHHDLQLMRR